MVIHAREAEDDAFEIMSAKIPRDYKIHLHCFCGSAEFARKLLGHFSNIYFGFTGLVTFAGTGAIRDIVRDIIPMNRFVLETDAPYMCPLEVTGNFGKPKPLKKGGKAVPSHPGRLPMVARKIAEAKNMPVEDIMVNARQNTVDLYGI